MPEISRRCPTCQVVIRDQAFFCPQCGDKLDRPEPPAVKRRPAIHDTEEVVIDPNKTLTEADFRARNPAPTASPKPATRGKARTEVGAKIQKVTDKARGVEGDVKQRVQKFRDMSNVVIGEANYDPSLRFVLVAAALFVLFLVIVLLNKVID